MPASNVAVIPTTANRIRALAAANPQLKPRELAMELGIHYHLVELSLGKGDKRRVKSRAPANGGHAR